jgi:hypothetical protein
MPRGFANFYVRYRSQGIAVNLSEGVGAAGRIALPLGIEEVGKMPTLLEGVASLLTMREPTDLSECLCRASGILIATRSGFCMA